jgi:hypothetical protein
LSLGFSAGGPGGVSLTEGAGMPISVPSRAATPSGFVMLVSRGGLATPAAGWARMLDEAPAGRGGLLAGFGGELGEGRGGVLPGRGGSLAGFWASAGLVGSLDFGSAPGTSSHASSERTSLSSLILGTGILTLVLVFTMPAFRACQPAFPR